MFAANSRYAGLPLETVPGPDGGDVTVVPPAPARPERELGLHLRQQGQRLDHLAFRYLNDATAFWRLCELNGAMLADALAEAAEVRIPTKQR